MKKDRYEVLRLLGEGNQGKVFLVKNLHTGGLSAMKRMPFGTDGEGRQVLNRECEVLVKMNGRGTPFLEDYWEEGEEAVLVMQYIEGENLRKYMMEKKVLSEKETLAIIRRVAEILMRLQETGERYIYCDLKPENIMLSLQQEVTLVDFGGVLKQGEKNRIRKGTKEYLPAGEPFSVLTDIYSVGILMFEMMTDCIPGEGAELDRLNSVFISDAARALVLKAIHKNPSERFASMRELVTKLGEVSYMKNNRKKKGLKKKSLGQKNMYLGELKRIHLQGMMVAFLLLVLCASLFLPANLSGKTTVVGASKNNFSWRVERKLEEMGTAEKVNSYDLVTKDEYGRKVLYRTN